MFFFLQSETGGNQSANIKSNQLMTDNMIAHESMIIHGSMTTETVVAVVAKTPCAFEVSL